MSNQIYSIKHSHQHLNYITNLLAERPFKEAAPIIQSINVQVLQQQQAIKQQAADEAKRNEAAANDTKPVAEAAE